MRMYYRKLIAFVLLILPCIQVSAQSERQQEEAKKFILKVLSEYKNPLSYYPLRRDIFLPDEKEQAEIDMEHSYPEGARSLGVVVFASSDSDHEREPFVDADGDLLDLSLIRRKNYPSLKSNGSYFRKKQWAHINRYPTLGRFLYFNAGFSEVPEH